ncbi:MAG: hypothetical protein QY308_00205 [Ignavibacteriaceae bacterium]|nr:hypothetical protein [Ignavibacteriaceae bacterium]WKZ72635.1 MAG: hypothetical protein QY308_00205 [Ignavibacteriaceae bacterium]
MAVGFLSPEETEILLAHLQTEVQKHNFHRGSGNNFLRIIESSFNRAALLHDLLRYPAHLETLVTIATNSNYLTDILVRDPGFVYQIFDSSHLEAIIEPAFYREMIFASLFRLRKTTAKIKAIKSAKRREILATGVKDLLGYLDLRRATSEMSVVAKTLTEALFLLALSETCQKFGIYQFSFEDFARGNHSSEKGAELSEKGTAHSEERTELSIKGTAHSEEGTILPKESTELFRKLTGFAVICLGKLGGGELNYSSDIDLMVIFEENFTLPNGKEYYELLQEAIILFTDWAVNISEGGYLFRVDFRLRPDGSAAPLARTFRDTILYYETRGEDWERQMLIKAGYLCGNRALYDRFISAVTPFIYPANFFRSPLKQIATLRNEMVKSLGDEQNVKLFKGGIRDVEFSVQALQLLYGGKIKGLRTGNTLLAISNLEEFSILSPEEAEKLREGYIFLRKIEHYLQLMNDTQTHTIPAEGEMLQSLAVFFGFETIDDFSEKLETVRQWIRGVYKSVVGNSNAEFSAEKDISFFKDMKSARKNLSFLRTGSGPVEMKEFDTRTSGLWDEIEDRFLDKLRASFFPDRALQNFTRVINRTPFPSYWYDSMRKDFFLESVLRLCEYSEFSVDLLVQDGSLEDLVISGKLFEKSAPEEDFALSARALLFLVAARFTLGLIDVDEVSFCLSAALGEKIKRLIGSKYRVPEGCFIGIAGSFSAGKMHLFSDIDLFVVVDDCENQTKTEEWFLALLEDIRSLIAPLKADCRLRPEGGSSRLVWDIGAYRRYFEKRVAVWELQSLTKVSFLAGDENLYNAFFDLYLQKLATLDNLTVKREIVEMRKKLYPKALVGSTPQIDLLKGSGGTTDVDFVDQYLLLLNPEYLKFPVLKRSFFAGEGFREFANKDVQRGGFNSEPGGRKTGNAEHRAFGSSLGGDVVGNFEHGEFGSSLGGDVPKKAEHGEFREGLSEGISEQFRLPEGKEYTELAATLRFLRKVRLSIQTVYNNSNTYLPTRQKGEPLFRFLGFASYEEMAETVIETMKKNNKFFQQKLRG